jgi:hypothetical protein
MHRQLDEIIEEMESAGRRLRRLAQSCAPEQWSQRPAGGGWSAAECVAHLNLTSEALLPLLKVGIVQARALGGGAPVRFRRDFLGWLIFRSSRPGGRPRVKTKSGFVPASCADKDALVQEFERLQVEQIATVEEADGLPLQRVKITSPFDPRLRYSLYSAFTIAAAHQHRHLAQAERAAEGAR